jgi:hypothetical protein
VVFCSGEPQAVVRAMVASRPSAVFFKRVPSLRGGAFRYLSTDLACDWTGNYCQYAGATSLSRQGPRRRVA